MLKPASENGKLEIVREKIKKHEIKVVIIEKNDFLLVCGEKKEVFKALNWFQKEKFFRDVQIFVSDFGKLIELSSKEIHQGWREKFRDKTKVVDEVFKITFHFEAQIRRVILFLGLNRTPARNLIATRKGKIIAECVPRRKSCQISFVFSSKTDGHVKNIVFLPGLMEIEIKKTA